MKSLIGFHHTGCDAISAFAGREKVKPLKWMLRYTGYVKEFAQLGEQIGISGHLWQIIISFVCHMYEWKGNDSVDEIWYRMYCQSGVKSLC